MLRTVETIESAAKRRLERNERIHEINSNYLLRKKRVQIEFIEAECISQMEICETKSERSRVVKERDEKMERCLSEYRKKLERERIRYNEEKKAVQQWKEGELKNIT